MWLRRLAVVGGLVAMTVAYTMAEQRNLQRYYAAGQLQMERWVADCSLAEARAGRCFIPCNTDSDCVEKNGVEEY